MNVINDIELNKEYSTAAFLKILKIDSATFSKNKARFLNLFEGFFTYERYQMKQEQLGRYIAAKNEFKHYTGKYPMLMPLREKKGAW